MYVVCVMSNSMNMINHKIQTARLIWIIAVALLFAACGRKAAGGVSDAGGQIVLDGNGGELPMPAIPSALNSPDERSSYVAEHFWDAMDFSDTLRSHDSEFLERNFSNFVYLLPYAPASSAEKAVAVLMKRAEADKTVFLMLAGLAEKYLSEPDSPMRNEDLFMFFLNSQIEAGVLDESEKIRARIQLDTAKKNRPGMAAADFAYVDRDGVSRTLHGTKSTGNILLVFYDPECEHCSEITASLAADEMLAELQEKGLLTVLAIDTESDGDVWERTRRDMPQHWIVGHDDNNVITESALYDLPAMPVLYLLDADKTVILKDVAPDAILRELARL